MLVFRVFGEGARDAMRDTLADAPALALHPTPCLNRFVGSVATMTRLIAALLASAVVLTGCSGDAGAGSGGGPESKGYLQEALEAAPGLDEDGGPFSFMFGAPGSVREILDYTPRAGTAPTELTDSDRWGHFAANSTVPSQLYPEPLGVSLVEPGSPVGWISTSSVNGASQITASGIDVAAAKERLEAAGAETSDGGTYVAGPEGPRAMLSRKVVFTDERAVLMRDDAAPQGSLAEDEGVDALLGCLRGAELAFLKREEGTRTYAIAASVDENAEGEAWACIHAPGEDGQAVVDEVSQPRDVDHLPRTPGEASIDEDVIRVGIQVEHAPGNSGDVPPEASLVINAPESGPPYF